MSAGKIIRKLLIDKPTWVDGGLIALTSLATLILHFSKLLDDVTEPWSIGDALALTEFLGQLSATVAGFAGVVVVFGLTAGGDRMRQLRLSGGRALHMNWVSIVAGGFVAAFFSLFANVSFGAHWHPLALALTASALLLLLHSAGRLVWLFAQLASVVRTEDVDAADESPYETADEMFDEG